MVLLKDYSSEGFIFYTNLNSQKSEELKENPNASICFHWKSLLRQVRIVGTISQVKENVADEYYNTRGYESRIGAWASNQSTILKNRQELISSIQKYKKIYNNPEDVPRPKHWSGWLLSPTNIEFWLDGDSRIHERLKYSKIKKNNWEKFFIKSLKISY